MAQETDKRNSRIPIIQYNKEFLDPYNYLHMQISAFASDSEKETKFKRRLEEFGNVATLEEAKILLEKIMPVSSEKNTFYIGEGKCIIIKKHNVIRISFDSPTEFISYNFV